MGETETGHRQQAIYSRDRENIDLVEDKLRSTEWKGSSQSLFRVESRLAIDKSETCSEATAFMTDCFNSGLE